MNSPLVTIQLAVHNGERYIRSCLAAVRAQTHPNLEILIWDNASTDHTRDIIKEIFRNWKLPARRSLGEGGEIGNSRFSLIEHHENLGMWPAHEEILRHARGEFIVVLSVDVMMDPHFVERAVTGAERDSRIGSIQAKIYQYGQSRILDTCGFALTRARKVVNIGHGKPDGPAYAHEHDIFGVEGAVPFFRRSALEDCRIEGRIWDPDYFWYGDDLDLAWRMTLMGYRQVFVPNVVAWHDRSTTKDVENTGFLAYHVQRRKLRQRIPIIKRRLDWSNIRFTIIKNDYMHNILRDFFAIFVREINVQGYAGLFEPAVLLEWGRFLRLLPRMLARRRKIMANARCNAERMRALMLVDVHEQNRRPRSEWFWHSLRAVVVCVVFGFIVWSLFLIGSRIVKIF